MTKQRTCRNDPWTWTTVWELTVGAGGEMGRGKKGENWDNCSRVTIKTDLIKNFKILDGQSQN